MTQKLLVIFDGNWADEMDIEGFKIYDKGLWESYVNSMKEKPFTEYIGSNQEMEFSGKTDYLRNIKKVEISEEECAVLVKFFPHGFGKFVEPEFYDEEEENEQD